MPPLATAPDLCHGFMINGGSENNLWQTDIQCVVSRRCGTGERQWAYLATPCRAEDVTPGRIFSNRSFEAAVLSDWNGTFMTRGGAALRPPFPWQKRSVAKCRINPMPASRIHCDEVAVLELGLGDLLQEFAAPAADRNNDLFLKADWSCGGWDWELFTRCRYTNYSNPERDLAPYVQPITGPVLIGDENGQVGIGYFAAYVDEGGTRTQEAVLRLELSVLDLYATFAGKMSGAVLRLMHLVGLGRIFRTEDYAAPKSLGGRCRFFRYSPQ